MSFAVFILVFGKFSIDSDLSIILYLLHCYDISWVFPIFHAGRKPDYGFDDLYRPLKSHDSEILGDKLSSKVWGEKYASTNGKIKEPNLLLATCQVFSLQFIFTFAFLFFLEFVIR